MSKQPNITVKDLKQFINDNIETYEPTDRINCTSVKVNDKYYRHSTNVDDNLVDFIKSSGNTIKIYTK